jgi:DNA-directed RNA polymerase specialized sigma24 family protein
MAADVARTELLVGLLSRRQDELFRYTFALLPHEDDARDVLQETSVALYRKFEEYDPCPYAGSARRSPAAPPTDPDVRN